MSNTVNHGTNDALYTLRGEEASGVVRETRIRLALAFTGTEQAFLKLSEEFTDLEAAFVRLRDHSAEWERRALAAEEALAVALSRNDHP